MPFDDIAGLGAGLFVVAVKDVLTQEMAGVVIVNRRQWNICRRVLKIADGLIECALIDGQTIYQQRQRHTALSVEVGQVELVETALKLCHASCLVRAASALELRKINAAQFKFEPVIRDNGNLVRTRWYINITGQRQA